MNGGDPNVALVGLVAAALGPLCDELVLVGGCCVGLLITDQARPPVRHTIDVDLVAEVSSLTAYYEDLSPKLRAQGFQESADHMCRWRRGPLILDVMPSEEAIFGHSTNRWYADAVRTANTYMLPNGVRIRIASPPLFLATKLEAFHDRGNDDYTHHDMEDIVNLVDGRPVLAEEVDDALPTVKSYLRDEFEGLLEDQRFLEQLPMHFRPDLADQARVEVLLGRLRRLAGL